MGSGRGCDEVSGKVVREVDIRMVSEGLTTKTLVCSAKDTRFYLVSNKEPTEVFVGVGE